MKTTSTALFLILSIGILGVTLAPASAARRKVRLDNAQVSVTSAPRASFGWLGRVFSTFAIAEKRVAAATGASVSTTPASATSKGAPKGQASQADGPQQMGLAAAPPRRPLGPLVVVVLPPKPVVSNF